MEDVISEELLDYPEILRRGGANHGDEDFMLFCCWFCRRVYLLEYEVETVYLDSTDLSRRVTVYNDDFICLNCGRAGFGDEASLAEGTRPEWGVTWADLVGSGWEWAVRR